MATNLLDLLTKEFSSDIVGKIASFLGENPAATQKAVSGVLPAVLGALAAKSSTPGGAADLLGLLKNSGLAGNSTMNFGSLLGSAAGAGDLVTQGATLAAQVFGTKQSGITSWLSQFSGINQKSSSSLLSLALPFILNFVGRQASSGAGLNASSLAGLLTSQGSFLQAAAPGISNLLGLKSFAEIGAPAIKAVEQTAASASSGMASILKVLLPLLALGVLFLSLRNCRTEQPVTTSVTTAPVTAPAVTAPAMPNVTLPSVDLGAFVKRMLPDNVELNVPANGIESRLIAFITDAAQPVSDTAWFSFDRLEFETASAVLKPTSQEQLKNIAAIMKAFPNVELKIGGYTDNVGDDTANLKLSQERAINTMNALVGLGVQASHLTAEGYGEEHPVASNDTEEGRQRNRRIDVRVTRK